MYMKKWIFINISTKQQDLNSILNRDLNFKLDNIRRYNNIHK